MTSEERAITIRDYIYTDTARIRSMYAQVHKGVVQGVVKSELTDETWVEGIAEKGVKAPELRREMMLSGAYVESRVLHDYMFSQLEERMSSLIMDLTGEAGPEELEIGKPSLIRVRGRPEIDDYGRMMAFMEKANEIGETIAAAQMTPEIEEMLKTLGKAAKDRKLPLIDRQKASAALKELEAKMKGAGRIPEETVKSLTTVYGAFYKDILEVSIAPGWGGGSVAFRAVLDRRYLREDLSLIWAKYGSRPDIDWTMLARTTCIPRSQPQELAVKEGEGKGGLRESAKDMYEALANFEPFFLGSQIRKEIIVSPLAIYSEVA